MPIDHYLYVSYIDSSVYGFGILALSLSVPLSLKSNHFPIQFGRQIAIFISDGFEQDVGVFPQAEQRMPLNELREETSSFISSSNYRKGWTLT